MKKVNRTVWVLSVFFLGAPTHVRREIYMGHVCTCAMHGLRGTQFLDWIWGGVCGHGHDEAPKSRKLGQKGTDEWKLVRSPYPSIRSLSTSCPFCALSACKHENKGMIPSMIHLTLIINIGTSIITMRIHVHQRSDSSLNKMQNRMGNFIAPSLL